MEAGTGQAREGAGLARTLGRMPLVDRAVAVIVQTVAQLGGIGIDEVTLVVAVGPPRRRPAQCEGVAVRVGPRVAPQSRAVGEARRLALEGAAHLHRRPYNLVAN